MSSALKNPSSHPLRWYAIAALALVADQVVKTAVVWTTPLGWLHSVTFFFNLVHLLNPGAAFSFLAGAGGWQRWFFLAIAFGVSAGLMYVLTRPLPKLEGLAYSLILGGALGNALDRTFRGSVVDYLDFHLHGWHWPAFNIADMAIVVGVIAMVLQTFTSVEKAREATKG